MLLKRQLILSIFAGQVQNIGILKIYRPKRNGGCMNMKNLWVNAMMSGQEADKIKKFLQYPLF